jgi:hypothetical protein
MPQSPLDSPWRSRIRWRETWAAADLCWRGSLTDGPHSSTFREKAPQKATRDMYLDAQGHPTRDSINGWRASGVPGTVRGLALGIKSTAANLGSPLSLPLFVLPGRASPPRIAWLNLCTRQKRALLHILRQAKCSANPTRSAIDSGSRTWLALSPASPATRTTSMKASPPDSSRPPWRRTGA